ncbi:hypothetical protein AOE01nite_12150 [Acetobacter oeni]|uniref:Uncharacterized protein n=1 Tax=Acetobacter oeni TaxID=304077 RepID=A0A511XJA1_9PROT|nr:hypothetical protein AOE01nite_12150 [Acetobacter oeni]
MIFTEAEENGLFKLVVESGEFDEQRDEDGGQREKNGHQRDPGCESVKEDMREMAAVQGGRDVTGPCMRIVKSAVRDMEFNGCHGGGRSGDGGSSGCAFRATAGEDAPSGNGAGRLCRHG